MKMSEIVRKLREETEYQEFFKAAMKKFNISSPADLKDPAKKKEFFDYVDKNYKAKVEGIGGISSRATDGRGVYPVHPSSNSDLKRAAAALNNYIKNTRAAQPDMLVNLVLDLVEAEIEQFRAEMGSELDMEY
jgi:hypothetical protein